MHITYASHHRWFRKNSVNPLEYFAGKNSKKIISSIAALPETGITHTIKPLTEDFFTDFTPLYTRIITGKENGELHDVQKLTLDKINAEFPYFGMSIYEDNKYIGGTIISLREDRIAYAFRAYERDWNKTILKASPAILAEYFIADYASTLDIEYISHGRDRNPYGMNSAIGLAGFKLSVGCNPLLSENFTVATLDTDIVTKDILVLKMPETGTDITKAFLVTKKDTAEKYLQVTKFPEQLQVETVYRD